GRSVRAADVGRGTAEADVHMVGVAGCIADDGARADAVRAEDSSQESGVLAPRLRVIEQRALEREAHEDVLHVMAREKRADEGPRARQVELGDTGVAEGRRREGAAEV